jgi:hypothetical protein
MRLKRPWRWLKIQAGDNNAVMKFANAAIIDEAEGEHVRVGEALDGAQLNHEWRGGGGDALDRRSHPSQILAPH